MSGRVFPTKFYPTARYDKPEDVFPTTSAPWLRTFRYTHRDNSKKMLIYTDGACIDNGRRGARAGWAFVYGPPTEGCVVSSRLEERGPSGCLYDQTSNRAELRAVIAALSYRNWKAEGFDTIVIATDSEYVASGATEWARNWVYNGWRLSSRDWSAAQVKNQDLWKKLLQEVERWYSCGVTIQFWRIPREDNGMADRAAKGAAERVYDDEWQDV
ncbi:hypothetical protein E4U21_001479 [Claviceps maximensis]|nr:hypothetical protein E4U21_001479 [Claviceps maximensis]